MNFNVELPQSLKDMLWYLWGTLGVVFVASIILAIIRSYIPDSIIPIIKGGIALVILGIIFYIAY
ncbi:hypothetical protein [Bacillus sp. 123MFChir2]|uniref:hypothetical protein n=1 Tax=Bacillus sp. 123MFChir2 TaxID=1169144 RepID=UPI00036B36A2|nr:hypothetical protein [Bacillus sp. 123MFChir2]